MRLAPAYRAEVTTSEVFAERVARYFERVHREVFAGDPAANANLNVEVVGAAMAEDTPVAILIAPWTLCGLAQPPDGRLPSMVRVGPMEHPALENEVDEIGSYWSVGLVPDVSGFGTQESAREAAEQVAGKFEAAIAATRRELTGVADAGRRSIFKTLGGKPAPTERAPTAFGSPDGAGSTPPGA